jgi:hypothetical protein
MKISGRTSRACRGGDLEPLPRRLRSRDSPLRPKPSMSCWPPACRLAVRIGRLSRKERSWRFVKGR